jgi:putative tricarboxylic transport membrane protein
MKNNDQRTGLFWLIVGLVISFFSTKYGLGTLSAPGPGFLPFITGLIMSGLAVIVFAQQVGKKEKETVLELWRNRGWPKVLLVMASLVVYTLLFVPLGFLLDTFLLITFLLRLLEPMGWIKVFGGAVCASGGSYVIFQLWLEAQLPKGFLGF